VSENIPPDDYALAELLARAGGVGEATVADRTYQAGRFVRWCEEVAPDDPIDETLVLAYLLDHPAWQWSTAKAAARAIEWCFAQHDQPGLCGLIVSRYLADLAATKGRTALPKTEPLRIEDAARLADAIDAAAQQPPTGRYAVPVAALRPLLVLARHVADPNEQIHHVHRNLLAPGALEVTTGPGGPILAVRLDALTAHVPLSTDQATAWQEHLTHLQGNSAAAERRIARALTNTGLPINVTAGELDDDLWGWVWTNIDPDTPRRVRDRAYLLVGLANARRHIELARLDISDVHPIADGYRLEYRRTKNGDPHSAVVAHLGDGQDPCPTSCPACALADQLRVAKDFRGQTTGPLLATRYGGELRTMTRQNGRLRVRHLTKAADGQAWGSTRSLRAGAATSAAERGWSLPQIAKLTGHRDLNQVPVYVRRHGTPLGTVQLSLD